MSANPPEQPATGTLVNVPRNNGSSMAVGTQRTGAMGAEMQISGETATASIAAAARAGIEARFVMARQYPRDIDRTRTNLLKACARPKFADVAIYRKPVGEGIEGPSIRLAEEAARAMGNIDTNVMTIYEDRERRILQVSVTDLEANLTYPMSVVVTKTVERSKVGKGQTAISSRYNSKGYQVFEVAATDDETLNKNNSLVSKALRTLLLRVVPGDILQEAMEACYATREKALASDPDSVKRMRAAYLSELKVNEAQLVEYLGHPVATVNVGEMQELRSLFTTIQDGEATWDEAIAHKLEQRGRANAAAFTGTPPAADPATPGAATPPQTAAEAGAAAGKSKPASLNDVAAQSKAAREAIAAAAGDPRAAAIAKARAAGRTTFDWAGKTEKVPPLPAGATPPELDKLHESMIGQGTPADPPEPGSEG
jgi:hypothetical protein